MDYVTIDFEASCLPRHGRSFPIEVGIADGDRTQSWLIKPIAEWRNWDWTQEALDLHGIAPETIEQTGLPAHLVFEEANRAIAGRRIIADSAIDAHWWRMLAGAAVEEDSCPIAYVGTLFDEMNAPSEHIYTAQRHADTLCPARHRAGDDARWLWILLDEIQRLLAGTNLPMAPLIARRTSLSSAVRSVGLAA